VLAIRPAGAPWHGRRAARAGSSFKLVSNFDDLLYKKR
jgi:hypothetical protein